MWEVGFLVMRMAKQVGCWLGQGVLILLPGIVVGQCLMCLVKLGRGSIWHGLPVGQGIV